MTLEKQFVALADHHCRLAGDAEIMAHQAATDDGATLAVSLRRRAAEDRRLEDHYRRIVAEMTSTHEAA
jgi:hypothetical protein